MDRDTQIDLISEMALELFSSPGNEEELVKERDVILDNRYGDEEAEFIRKHWDYIKRVRSSAQSLIGLLVDIHWTEE